VGETAVRHPVEVITIGLDRDCPVRAPVNDDVAFALVSRFNLRMRVGKHPRWSHLGERNLAESADYEAFWLRRLALFERVCIPSVVNLTPQPDAWFVAFGDVESWFVRELLERLRPYPWIRPYFREKGHPADAGPLRDLLDDFVRSLGKSYLCSTRFDSDDSLHQQFIGGLDLAITQLRERGYADETRCLNLLYGLVESGGELSVFLRRNNMFQSVFEPAERIAGPYAGGHDEIRERMPLVEIVTNLPMWIYHRHEDTLEPGWVTGRDRLSLADPDAQYPSFGLHPTTIIDAGTPTQREDTPALRAARLRTSGYWDASQIREAIALAETEGQPALARWLGGEKREPSDLAQVLDQFDSHALPLLNAGQLARLARELDALGETVLALRAFDYAVRAAPSDRHMRAERDALAGALAELLDLDEQMEMLAAIGQSDQHASSVVFVATGPSIDNDPIMFERVRNHAEFLAQAGFRVSVLLTSGSHHRASMMGGVTVESIEGEVSRESGPDARHRALLRELATRVADIGPSLLVPDGSPAAQRLAAAVGRGLGVPVDFALGYMSSERDQTGANT
jgi:hypothetical protein